MIDMLIGFGAACVLFLIVIPVILMILGKGK